MLNKISKYVFISFFIISIIIPIFYIPIFSDIPVKKEKNFSSILKLDSNFAWPTPGYNYITSPFGNRDAPNAYVSNDHAAIDIGAPENANIVSISDAVITFVGWNYAGGYSIRTDNGNIKVLFCHVSPNFIVHVGEHVKKGQIIGYVGPFNVYGISDNPYVDNNGNPTNGATTGVHLHFSVRKDGELIDPMELY